MVIPFEKTLSIFTVFTNVRQNWFLNLFKIENAKLVKFNELYSSSLGVEN